MKAEWQRHVLASSGFLEPGMCNEQDFPATISPEVVMLEHDVSYTIYARPRPIRTALVLDTTVFREGTWRCEALFDGIVASAVESWGGRSNPIVVTPD
jgi:hypothetical protein